jgi:hypothetical protein
MSDSVELKKLLLTQLAPTHERFAALMQERMEHAELADLERYFALLSTLVTKLEDGHKPLRDVMREMASEYAAAILLELNR